MHTIYEHHAYHISDSLNQVTTGFELEFILRCKFTGRPAKITKMPKYDHDDQNSLFSGSQNVKHAPGMVKKEKYSYLLTISEDSRYLVIKKNKYIEIRKVTDLNKIVLKLPVNGATSVGFDMKAGRLYVADGTNKLLVFNPKGKLLKTFKLRINISKICLHPHGNGKMLIITNSSSLYWLTLRQSDKKSNL